MAELIVKEEGKLLFPEEKKKDEQPQDPAAKQTHIAVAGNIGAGKTTLVQKLSKHYNWKAFFESVEDNPYLEDFYDDMRKWSFPLQIFFLHSRFNQIKTIREMDDSVIQDRSIYEDAHIFAKNLHKSGFMSDRDFANYFAMYQSMAGVIEAPDLLIYLKADIPKLIGQIAKRGRDYENNISIRYLEDLNRHYEEWIGGYGEGKLLVIDVNKLDFVNNPDDMAYIIRKIDAEIHGLF